MTTSTFNMTTTVPASDHPASDHPASDHPAGVHPGMLGDIDPARTTHWTIDRRVPLAVILTMLIQFGAIVYWVATLNGTVMSQGERITHLEADRTNASQTLSAMQALLARIDERTAYLTDALRQRAAPK